jgi:hypothetical protein
MNQMLLSHDVSKNPSNFQWNYENTCKELVKYIVRKN